MTVKKSPKKKAKAAKKPKAITFGEMSHQQLVERSVTEITAGEQMVERGRAKIELGKQFMDLAQKKITDEKAIFEDVKSDVQNEVAAENHEAVKSILPENTQMSLGI